MIIIAIAVPATMDCVATPCFHDATLPAPSRPTWTECTAIGRYRPALMSSSRVYCRRTGARPLMATATLTAATVKSLYALARRPKLPPETSECSLTLSSGSPAAFAANM